MKIAVYTIAKNEAHHIRRWADSTQEADYRLILDTGSTDHTTTTAGIYGVTHATQVFDPWRFDVARNHALSLLPDDIDLCIALDMDEILTPGWRQALETIPANTTRPRYKYVWSWNNDGTEGLVYGGDKIHARHGYRWKHAVHEILQPVDILEQQHWVTGLEIHHHPDPTKSRGQYFDLLKLAVKEEPYDDRNQFYLGREYFYHGDHTDATRHLVMATLLSKWPPEIAAAYRMLYNMNRNVTNLYRALQVDPCRRETLVALAKHYHDEHNWQACYQYANAALCIIDKPLDYLCEADSWGWLPYDLMAVACWHMGHLHEARIHGEQAALLNPTDDRLKANLVWYGV